MDAAGRFVAVDWGTTRLRASLVGSDGGVVERTQSDLGVQSVPAGGFPQALAAACGAWFAAEPDLPVLMCGMVGSRNGWVEAPYLRCPCGVRDAAARLTRIEGLGRDVLLVPGADTRGRDGSYDVMRGEETQAFGAGLDDGLVCLPGTHSKWVEVRAGRLVDFATFVTGELYAALSASFVARLADGPDDAEDAADETRRALGAGGGLTRALFQARTRVLAGDMRPQAVRPLIARLLVEAEVDGAATLFGRFRSVRLVAAEPQLALYGAVLAARGVDVTTSDPSRATLDGLARIMAARRAA